MPLKRGVAVWISGFLTFLAGLNAFNAVMLWAGKGHDSIINPYLIGDIIGGLQVMTYFWVSITTTFVFLGLTSVIAHRRLPPDPAIVKMLVNVGGNLAATRKALETTKNDLSERLESNKMFSEELFKKANINLENARKEMLVTLGKQAKAIQEVREDMSSAIETNVRGVREEMLGVLEKQEKAIQKVNTNLGNATKETMGILEAHGKTIQNVGRLSKRGTATIKKQMVELADIGTRLEKLERELTPPQPRLTSQNSPEEIKGIGPRLGEELRLMGITNVGEFITSDPTTIAERTHVSRERVARLQAIAQLLMVPGIDEKDAKLLEEVGITTRKELADQDSVLLNRKIGEIAKNYIEHGKMLEDEKPTIEEMSSWIKLAKF